MTETKWALILGASSGFGEGAARALAQAGYDIAGVHLDRKAGLEHVAEIRRDLETAGRKTQYFNINAADDAKRNEVLAELAGQKLNVAVTAAFALLFAVSGFFLWYGERDTRYRLPGAVALHDALTYASLLLVLYLAVLHPATRHALRGITLGSVDEEWARRHHAKWAHPSRQTEPEP
ncbi:MAG: SDR family NAD(P)-dependent oxidoreductase [Myxococcota bacterium]